MSGHRDPAFHSAVWPQVADLRLRLQPHVQLLRQHYRGALWYVLEDRAAGRYFRFTPEAHALIGLMDGERTLDEVHRLAGETLGDRVPTQDEVIQLLAQLHSAGVLASQNLPDLAELETRANTTARKKLFGSFKNPLGIRIPLFDIDGFLAATLPFVRPLFSWLGFLAWCALIVWGVVTAAVNWTALSTDLFDQVLSAQGIALLAIAYPVVKLLHELGHGYAIKHFGGQVQEVGVMLLVFMPVPYVDASAATAYQSRRARIVVGAAGIMVELAVASLCMIAWAQMEPGILRALAFNAMLIGGISTLLFNGNPLLRFDGYYVFADLIEVPNLGQRSNKYLGYLVRRYGFGVAGATSPVTARGEAKWLAGYAIAAFLYRIVIMIGIAMFVAGKFFFIGIALACWSVFQMLGLPIIKAVIYLLSAQELEARRGRAMLASAALVALIAGPLALVPVPFATVVQGVVWAPGDMRVTAGTTGLADAVLAAPGEVVETGAPLVRLVDPLIDALETRVAAEVAEGRIALASSTTTDPLRATIDAERLSLATAQLSRIEERRGALEVRAAAGGIFHPVDTGGLEGRTVPQGALLGYVLRPEGWVVRVAIPQTEIELVTSATEAIAVRLASDPALARGAVPVARTPQATVDIPSRALTTAGGGEIVADPASDGLRALESVFLLDLAVEGAGQAMPWFGERVHVRFDHGRMPLAAQLWRAGRQVFLDRFGL